MENRIDKYHSLFFGSEIGREVLADLLHLCHFGSTLDSSNHQQVGEYNVGVAILSNCGTFGQGTLPKIINSLSGVTPEVQNETDQDYFSDINDFLDGRR